MIAGSTRAIQQIQTSENISENSSLQKQEEKRRNRPRQVFQRLLALAAAVLLSISTLSPSLQAEAASNQQIVFEYLTDDLGYSVAAACGIMANISVESGYSPNAGNSSGAYGLCQWMGSRRSRMRNWCSSNGFSSSSVEGQLAFLDHELQTSYPSVYYYLQSVENTSDGAYDAAYYFCYHYEAPANRGGQSSRRGSIAAGSLWAAYSKYAVDMWEDTESGKKYWHKEGYYQTGWMKLDGDRYYFDAEGILRTGVFNVSGSTYYADEDGVLQTGWQSIGNSTYYFGKDGVMETGWIEVEGTRYYLDANGKLSSVNAFAEKSGTTDADIVNAVTAQENAPTETISAPAAEPAGIEDKIADTVQSVKDAGADSQSAASVSAIGSAAGKGSSSNSDSSNSGNKSSAKSGSSAADSSISIATPGTADITDSVIDLGGVVSDEDSDLSSEGITITTK